MQTLGSKVGNQVSLQFLRVCISSVWKKYICGCVFIPETSVQMFLSNPFQNGMCYTGPAIFSKPHKHRK